MGQPNQSKKYEYPDIQVKFKSQVTSDSVIIESAKREWRFLVDSVEGKKSAWSCKVPKYDIDGKLEWYYDSSGKRTNRKEHGGIRVFKTGIAIDIDKDDVNTIRQTIEYYLPPSLPKPGIQFTSHTIKYSDPSKPPVSKFLSNFEKCTFAGRTIPVLQAKGVKSSEYVFKWYRDDTAPFNKSLFDQLCLEDERDKASQAEEEKTKKVIPFPAKETPIEPIVEPEPIEQESNVQTSNSPTLNVSGVPTCKAIEYLQTSNLATLNVEQELKVINGKLDLLLDLILNQEPVANVDTELLLTEIRSATTKYITVPNTVSREDTKGRLKGKVDLRDECNTFMRMVIESAFNYGASHDGVPNGIGVTLVFDMHKPNTEFNRLMEVFLLNNKHMNYKEATVSRGRGKNKESVTTYVKPSTIDMWLKNFRLDSSGIVTSMLSESDLEGE